jgi:hypothetical protein
MSIFAQSLEIQIYIFAKVGNHKSEKQNLPRMYQYLFKFLVDSWWNLWTRLPKSLANRWQHDRAGYAKLMRP